LVRARALLENARKKNANVSELWLEAVRVELRAGNKPAAQALMASALQECPTSGILWSESIFMEVRPQRMLRGLDALKKTNNDPFVVCGVARVFWETGKIEKARTWFERAVELQPDIGDFWAYYYKFEIQHGTQEQQNAILSRCSQADPRHGEVWASIRKSIHNFRKDLLELLKIATLKVSV
jgi:pre-mRNA-processing factor 6